METRASYVAVGAFVLVLILGLVGFVVWMGEFQGRQDFARYDITFSGSVTGLQVDGTVRYRGIAVGRIVDIRIDPDNIELIRVTIEIQEDTPVRRDTVASIELQGITGVTYVLLSGGTMASEPLPRTMSPPYPLITSRRSRLEELFQGAPDLLSKANELVDRVTLLVSEENREAVTQTLANLRTLTERFAAGGGNLDTLLESGASALENVNRMTAELELLAKDVRAQLTTHGPEGTPTVADVLAGGTAAIERLGAAGGEIEQLARELRTQVTAPGGEGSPSVADLVREGTSTLQQMRGVGAEFEQLAKDLRRELQPGGDGRTTVADVLARGSTAITQLDRTAREFEQFSQELRAQLTTPGEQGAMTVADLVREGTAALQDVRAMSTEFQQLARALRQELTTEQPGATTLGSLLNTANAAAANIGRMSAEIEGLARDLRGEFSNMSGEHGERVSGLLTEATEAAEHIGTMSREFEALAKELRANASTLGGEASSAFVALQTAAKDLGSTSRSIADVADQLDATIAENREPLRDFSSTGLYELTQFLTEMRLLVASMTRVSSQIERDPARFFLGDRREGFQTE
jgi:phospholipid/cholesterol/gamma-HCH transport system substrate-binding protein